MKAALGATIMVAAWALAACAAALAVDGGQRQEQESLSAAFAGRAESSATSITAYVDDVFRRGSRMAAAFPSRRLSDAGLSHARLAAGFATSAVLDARGRVLASSPVGPTLHAGDFAAEPHVEAALAGELGVSGVVPSSVGPIIEFALPFDGSAPRVLVSGFSVEGSPLVNFVAVPPLAGARGYIVDRSGAAVVFAGEDATDSLNGYDWSLDPGEPLVVDGRLIVSAAISGTPWRLVLSAPEHVVVAPATANDRVEWSVLVVTSLALLCGLFVLRFVRASRRRSSDAQAESEQRFRLTVDNAPIGMTMVDLGGRFLRPNAELCRMLGYEADQLVQLTFREITHPDDLDVDADLLQRLVAGEFTNYQREKRYHRRDGSTLWVRLSVSVVRDADGEPLHFVGQVEDMTAMRAAQETLERRALYDSLTGLANRSLLMDRLAHALDDQRREEGEVAVAFCDLDHFKRVNDSLGHHAGDVLLQEVARRLQDVVRGGDTVARIGGDEFVLILPRSSPSEMATVLDRAKHAVAEPIEVDGHSLIVSFSAGLAMGGPDHSAEMLLRDADTALYAAKEGGRSRSEVYSAAMRSRALLHLSVEEELRRAIANDEFELHYQPIVALLDRRTVSFEALLRWRHPNRGLLLPAAFLDVAEESHLMIELGRLVLRHACQFLGRHPDATWRVYVNVSPVQLGRDLSGVVRTELAAAGVSGSRLGLEITENSVLDAMGSSLTEMQELRQMGIELLMDDFGTGYSALSSVLTTPITGIKLDQSFTAGLGKDEVADRITSTVADLVASLGAYGVVEGIETEDQCARAQQHGWVHGQGYLFARPMPEAGLRIPQQTPAVVR